MSNSKLFYGFLLAGGIGVLVGSVISYLIGAYRPFPISNPPIVDLCCNGVVVHFPEHPPWAASHVIDVEWKAGSQAIEMTERYSVLKIGKNRINNLQPVFLTKFPEGETELYYFGERGMTQLGSVHRLGDHVSWLAVETGVAK